MMRSQPSDRFASLCRDIHFGKMLSAAAYGKEANIYNPPTIADLELSTPQCLLLALIHSLVSGDLMSSILLAEICHRVQQLRSRHLRVWLLEDFEFPRTDIETAMSLLGQLVADGTLKLPTHVMTIMTSLAKKYRITNDYLKMLSEEYRRDLAIQLENAVANNSPRDIFELESVGADVRGSTQSGERLLNLAARTGSSASIAALFILKADLDVVNSSNVTPLEEAIKYNCASSVKTLLKAGAKLDKCLIGGDTYLHIAAAGGHNEALEALLEGEFDVNRKNRLGETPLAQAIRAGNVQGIALLQERGADFNALSGVRLDNDDSIVHFLARSGKIEILELLKDKKIPADLKNKNGLTPLHEACDPSVVGLVLRMGADVNAQDNTGSTPLMIAARNCKPDIVSFLLESRADPMIIDNEGRNALHYAAEGGCTTSVTILLDNGVMVNEQDNNGNTPAFFAAIKNNQAVLKLLVDKEVDLALGENYSDGLLHREARSGHVEVVKALLDAGAAVDLKEKNQQTALHWAARKGRTAVVRTLLDARAEVNVKDDDQWTALHLAAWKGRIEVATVLLNRGADLTVKTVEGWTPLHYASANGQSAVVQLLVDRGADVTGRTNDGHTALQLAAWRGHTAAVRALLEVRVAVNMREKDQNTALHLAAWGGYPEVATVLLDGGADLTLRHFGGWTSLIAASYSGHLAVVQLLVDRGAEVNARTDEGHTALYWADNQSHAAVADYLRSVGGVE